MESSVTAPVAGHIKRVVVHEGECTKAKINIRFAEPAPGDSINQGDLTVEIVH
jgi:pyruvate carboxylase